MKLAKNKDDPNAFMNICILAKNPANGGTPAKLKKAIIPLKPKIGFNAAIDERSTSVLLFCMFFCCI